MGRGQVEKNTLSRPPWSGCVRAHNDGKDPTAALLLQRALQVPRASLNRRRRCAGHVAVSEHRPQLLQQRGLLRARGLHVSDLLHHVPHGCILLRRRHLDIWVQGGVGDEGTLDRLQVPHHVASLLFVTNISCNNASLVHLSLSVNQIVKSCVPLPTMILSVAFERDANGQPKSYSKGVIVSLLITVLGSVLAVYGNPEASPFGLALVIISTLAVALWSVMSAMLLGPDSGLNAISLTWYASIISFVLLFILWLCSSEREAATAYLSSRPGDAALIILVGSSTAFVYNLVHFALIKVTSALTSAVAGNIKILLIIILSMIFFEKQVTILNYSGFAVFLVGVFAYSTFIYRSKMQAALKPAESGDALVSRPKIEGSTERTVLISGQTK